MANPLPQIKQVWGFKWLMLCDRSLDFVLNAAKLICNRLMTCQKGVPEYWVLYLCHRFRIQMVFHRCGSAYDPSICTMFGMYSHKSDISICEPHCPEYVVACVRYSYENREENLSSLRMWLICLTMSSTRTSNHLSFCTFSCRYHIRSFVQLCEQSCAPVCR